MPAYKEGKFGGIPREWIVGGVVIVIIAIVLRSSSRPLGNNTANSSSGTSVINATNSPMAPVTSMGHVVNQGLPSNQVSDNEPGTAPIIRDSGGALQYGP